MYLAFLELGYTGILTVTTPFSPQAVLFVRSDYEFSVLFYQGFL
jgi:hypothetical protein